MRALRGPLAFGLGVILVATSSLAQEDESKNPEKDVKKYALAVEKAPDDAESWRLLARAYVQLERYEEAVAPAQKAVELGPESPWAHLYLGAALQGTGKAAEAVAAYEKAVGLDPTIVAAQERLAAAYLDAARHDDAIRQYKELLKLKPENVGPIYNNLGTAHAKKGDAEGAVRWFEKMIEAAPDDPLTYYNLGVVYRRLGKNDEAFTAKSADMLVKAAGMMPADLKVQFAAGEQLFRAGRPAEAKPYFERVLQADPKGAKTGPEIAELAKAYLAEIAK